MITVDQGGCAALQAVGAAHVLRVNHGADAVGAVFGGALHADRFGRPIGDADRVAAVVVGIALKIAAANRETKAQSQKYGGRKNFSKEFIHTYTAANHARDSERTHAPLRS